MNRRTTPPAQRDDDAFPIRLKFAVPPEGLGKRLDDINDWLKGRLPPAAFAVHNARALGTSAMAIHFNAIADAINFLEAFPDLPLALRKGARHG